jgi:hypothetical protein
MMKQYLARTLLFGIGAGIFLFLATRYWITASRLVYAGLFLLFIILFVITEVSPRQNSESVEAKINRLDKVLLFILLAVSGFALYCAWAFVAFTVLYPTSSGPNVVVLAFLGAVFVIYAVFAFIVLRRWMARPSGGG